MAVHAKKSIQLLESLKKSPWLPPFSDKMIKEVAEEMLNDIEKIQEIAASHDLDDMSKEDCSAICLYNDTFERNRRCLLAYLNYRLERIEALRFEVGVMVPEGKMQNLHESERQYFHQYNKILDTYMKRYVPNCKEPLDLTADAEAPKDPLVQIRVREAGLGDIVTADSGVVHLQKGTMLFVKRTDVEHLIRAGKVEHVRTRHGDAGA